jgi:hypothetical protein
MFLQRVLNNTVFSVQYKNLLTENKLLIQAAVLEIEAARRGWSHM